MIIRQRQRYTFEANFRLPSNTRSLTLLPTLNAKGNYCIIVYMCIIVCRGLKTQCSDTSDYTNYNCIILKQKTVIEYMIYHRHQPHHTLAATASSNCVRRSTRHGEGQGQHVAAATVLSSKAYVLVLTINCWYGSRYSVAAPAATVEGRR